MAMKDRKINNRIWKTSKLWRRLRPRPDELETSKLYTDEELQNLSQKQINSVGIIRPDTGDLHLPTGLEESTEGDQTDSAFQVMLVIVILTLIFIGMITYFVSQMPKKD
jgi:hypothetical protein